MEKLNFSEESKKENPETLAGYMLEIDDEIKRFGGVQKYVLLESDKGFIFGTSSAKQHLDIKEQLEQKFGTELINRGGGTLSFFGDEIRINNNFSFKMGPLQISYTELQSLLQKTLGGEYTITLEED